MPNAYAGTFRPWRPSRWYQGGGAYAALRAYRAYHPAARIIPVTYNGRDVWMTEKQYSIWQTVHAHWRQGKLLTLEGIARRANCSTSTVSRFLHRLCRWRFINLYVARGPGGGIVVTNAKVGYITAAVQRVSRKVRKSPLANWRKGVDRYMADLVQANRGSRVVIRSQVLLSDWFIMTEGRP